jgi:hypothetical protein
MVLGRSVRPSWTNCIETTRETVRRGRKSTVLSTRQLACLFLSLLGSLDHIALTKLEMRRTLQLIFVSWL